MITTCMDTYDYRVIPEVLSKLISKLNLVEGQLFLTFSTVEPKLCIYLFNKLEKLTSFWKFLKFLNYNFLSLSNFFVFSTMKTIVS